MFFGGERMPRESIFALKRARERERYYFNIIIYFAHKYLKSECQSELCFIRLLQKVCLLTASLLVNTLQQS